VVVTTPIPVFPWPLSDARLELLKAAKQSLSLDYRIEPVEAAYGSPGRVLCFGETPGFLCKTAPIRPENVDSVASIAAALRFALEDSGPQFDEASLLSKWMGGEVRLIGVEKHQAAVAFR
jgi:hypothetical protein